MNYIKQPKELVDINMVSMTAMLDAAVDVTGAAVVDVQYTTGSNGESVLWVNVNGICAVRICQIKELNVRKA